MVSLCIPVLKNYKGMEELIKSAETGSIIPDEYIIVDNGNKINEVFSPKLTVIKPDRNMGVARSWNVLINNTKDQRIISNDDIILGKNTVENMLNTQADIVSIKGLNAYSLFLIRDSVIDKVGYFDEEISPNYAYFEDNDMDRRIKLAGLNRVEIEDNDYTHKGSVTFGLYTSTEVEIHHKKFRRARDFYTRKWGGVPGLETYTIQFNENKEKALTGLKDWKEW